MSPASKPEGLEVEADVGEDAVRVDVAAPGTGVGDTNRGVLRDLTDDAETEVGLILEFRTFDRGELAALAHLDVHETFGVTEVMRPPEISRQSDRHVAHGERNSGTNTERGDLDVVLDFVGLEAVADGVVNHGIRFDTGPGEADVRGDLRNAQVKVVRTFNEALQDGGVCAGSSWCPRRESYHDPDQCRQRHRSSSHCRCP